MGVADVSRQAGTGVPDRSAQFGAEDVGDLVVRQGARTGDRPGFPAVGGGVEKRRRGDRSNVLGVHERGRPVAGRDDDLVAVANVGRVGGGEVLVEERGADERPGQARGPQPLLHGGVRHDLVLLRPLQGQEHDVAYAGVPSGRDGGQQVAAYIADRRGTHEKHRLHALEGRRPRAGVGEIEGDDVVRRPDQRSGPARPATRVSAPCAVRLRSTALPTFPVAPVTRMGATTDLGSSCPPCVKDLRTSLGQ